MCLVPRVGIENDNSPDSIPIQNRDTVQKLKIEYADSASSKINFSKIEFADSASSKINFSKIEFARSAYFEIYFFHK